MKIAIVCNEYPPGMHGGIGTATRNLAQALSGAGHQVRVIGCYPADDPEPSFNRDGAVHVWRYRVPAGAGGWIRARWGILKTVSSWARHGEVDLVEVPDYGGMAALWGKLRVPVLGRICGAASYFQEELGQPVEGLTYWLEKRSLKRCNFWCAKSNYAARRAERFFGLGEGSVHAIYNPVPMGNFPTEEQRSRNEVVFANTLTPKKGIVGLILAWRRVVAEAPEARLQVYGKDKIDPEHGSMKKYLESLLPGETRKTVQFHGHVPLDTVRKALARARAAVYPSYAETFGNAPVEAMAAGCPTIYTKLSCGPEIVRDGVDGLLVNPTDPEEISGTILRLLKDDQLAERLGNAGRRTVKERFSPETITMQNVKFFSECIHNFRSAVVRDFNREALLENAVQ